LYLLSVAVVCSIPQVYLWAVDGLMGLVMNGIPNNMGGSRTMRTPRAVLWGQYHGPLTWAQPAASQHVDLACDVKRRMFLFI
jgi:hypothetical protein